MHIVLVDLALSHRVYLSRLTYLFSPKSGKILELELELGPARSGRASRVVEKRIRGATSVSRNLAV